MFFYFKTETNENLSQEEQKTSINENDEVVESEHDKEEAEEDVILNKYNPVSQQDNPDSRFTLPDYPIDGLSDHEPMYQPEDPGEEGEFNGKQFFFCDSFI